MTVPIFRWLTKRRGEIVRTDGCIKTPICLLPLLTSYHIPTRTATLTSPPHSLLSRIFQIAMAPFTHLIFLAIAFGGFTQVLAKPVSTDDAIVERDDGSLELCRTINCAAGDSSPPTESFSICCSGGHTTSSDPNSDSGSTTGDTHPGPNSPSGSTANSSPGLIVTTGHLSDTMTDGSIGEGSGSPLTQITATYDPDQPEPAGAGLQFDGAQLLAVGPQNPSEGAAGERVDIDEPQGLNLSGPAQAAPSGPSSGGPPSSGSNGGNTGSDGGSGNTGGSSTSGPSNGNQGNGSGGANGDTGNTGGPSTSGANGGSQGTGSGGPVAGTGNAGNSSNSPSSGAGSANAGTAADNQGNGNQGTNGNGSGSGTGSGAGSGQQGSNANGSGGSAASGQGSNPGSNPANGGSGSPLTCNCVCG